MTSSTPWYPLASRHALLHPTQATLDTLGALRCDGLRVGVLSNIHALESRSWDRSPLARLVDAAVLSHEVDVMKPDTAAYAAILDRLGVSQRPG